MNFDTLIEVIHFLERHRGLVVIVTAIFSTVSVVVGYLLGKYHQHRAYQMNRRQEFSDKVCVLAFALRRQPNGKLRLSRRIWGDIMPVSQVFIEEFLQGRIVDEASDRPGVMRLDDPLDQRLMLAFARTHVSGNNHRANLDFLTGRPGVQDKLYFTVASYKAHYPDLSVLERDIGMIEIIVLYPGSIAEMKKPDFPDTVELGTEVSHEWARRVHLLALSLDDELAKPLGESAFGIVDIES